jgi:hypothetical protein
MSVIVLIVDVYSIFAGEGKSDSPIATDRDRPSALQLSLERMQSKAG